jgi:uncharacterized protein (TIGR03067 family)
MRYHLRTLLIVLALGPPIMAQEAQLPILGKWRIVAQESEGRVDDSEPVDETVTFAKDHVLCDDDGTPLKCKCSYDTAARPRRVEWQSPERNGLLARGIWRMDGGSLQICVRIGPREKLPEFPREFKSIEGDPTIKLLLFSRSTDESPEP